MDIRLLSSQRILTMLNNLNIWRALDQLAEAQGLSASGLAKRAGLDPTSFNPSKRQTSDGKLRWPTTESISKVLDATGISFADFVRLVDGTQGNVPAQERTQIELPLLKLSDAQDMEYFTADGVPQGNRWDAFALSWLGEPSVYALEVTDEAYAPIYHDGDILLVSPHEPVRKGDRVVIALPTGGVELRQVHRQTAARIELRPLASDNVDLNLARNEISWLGRIVGVNY